MTITEWFARAVAAGLMPEWENIWCVAHHSSCITRFYLRNIGYDGVMGGRWEITGRIEDFYEDEIHSKSWFNDQEYSIQLRKDGKDLYSLEWRKANDWESYKFFKVWYKQGTEIVLTTFTFEMLKEKCRCLLADHNQIAPTEADFNRIYGE